MNVFVLILCDNEIETAYDNYKKRVEKVFNDPTLNIDNNLVLVNYIESLKKQAIEFDNLLKKKYSNELKVYSEEFYKNNIFDIKVENLLSNGLYSKNEIGIILKENKIFLSEKLIIEFSDYVEKINVNEKILFWNL